MSTDPDAIHVLLASAGSEPDPLLQSMEPAWSAAGLRVEHVVLDPALPDPELEDRLLDALRSRSPVAPLVLGGFSLGARIAAKVSPSVASVGLICFGYPFHVRGEPGNRHGLSALEAVRVPTLIVQGSRDSHGNRQEVAGYRLPACVRLRWLEDGNHRFRPRARSGETETDHVRSAAAASVAFIRTLESPAQG